MRLPGRLPGGAEGILRPSRLGVGALIIAALAVGRFVDETLPTSTEPLKAFERHGVIGQTVPTRWAEVEVVRVDGAPEVATFEGGPPGITPGLWLIVEVDAVPTRDQTSVAWAELRDGAGRVFTRGRGTRSCAATNPGLRTGCVISFEVDPDTLPGSRVVLGTNMMDQRADDLAVIDLGIEPADVAAWSSRTEPLVLPSARAGGQAQDSTQDGAQDGTLGSSQERTP